MSFNSIQVETNLDLDYLNDTTMKKNIFYFCFLFLLNSCVQLPNLLPNGSGEDSDMVIVEYNTLLRDLVFDDVLVVDEMLSIDFVFTPSYIDCAADYKMKVLNGHILLGNKVQVGLEIIDEFQYLNQGDLLGGLVQGVWKNEAIIYSIQDFFQCVTFYNINDDTDAIIGFRFKGASGLFHYGWMVFYLDTTSTYSKLYLKAIAYNKLPGVNVRVGR